MKNKHGIFIIGMVLLISCTTRTEQENLNILTENEKEGGWKLLFDGRTTAGWRNFNSDTLAGWEVKEGMLIALGQGGDHANDIITEDMYDNFELYLEWKLDTGANSGIFFNAREIEGVDAIYEIAPEYQIIDDEGWQDDLAEWQKTGACYAMYSVNENKKLKPVGEFNSSRIMVSDSTVQHYLNGDKILEYNMWSADWQARVDTGKWKDFPNFATTTKGYIGLQDHGKKIYFRNIKIREL